MLRVRLARGWTAFYTCREAAQVPLHSTVVGGVRTENGGAAPNCCRRLMPGSWSAASALCALFGVLLLAALAAAPAQAAYDSLSLVSIGPGGGNANQPALYSGVADSGVRVFFSTDESLAMGDTDASNDAYESTGATASLLSTGPAGGAGAFPANWSTASSSGDRI